MTKRDEPSRVMVMAHSIGARALAALVAAGIPGRVLVMPPTAVRPILRGEPYDPDDVLFPLSVNTGEQVRKLAALRFLPADLEAFDRLPKFAPKPRQPRSRDWENRQGKRARRRQRGKGRGR